MKKIFLSLILIAPLVSSNEYHESLMKMTSEEKRNFWTNFMKINNEDCTPTTIKFLAVTKYDNGSQWSIGCRTSKQSNKDGLWVNLKPDGTSKIMECKYLEQMGGTC